MTRRVLVLGGTADGRLLAERLAELPDVRVTYSLAGRVTAPALPQAAGAARIRAGGFGGVDGLVDYLRSARITAVIDGTHPFAAVMTGTAVAGCRAAGVPLLVMRRPGWTESAGDRWHRVPSLDAAARALDGLGERVFLTTGRSSAAVFAGLDRHWFLLRSVEAPGPVLPARSEILLERGPFTVEGETALMRRYQVDVVVTKDSGGTLTAAKLSAARALGLPVVMVDRPPLPAGAATVPDSGAALRWLDAQCDGAGGPPDPPGTQDPPGTPGSADPLAWPGR
ncbi:cobalt-precorrin-6A reductase [Frankia sp. Cpl3]|uniref:cobalt-precorrin-6A reductase n=1 Tax=Parafrankia colletiae TaxID=573497 RepID=UPI000B20E0BA|nr:cobalt-precorrin-6A reductase [Parafrankia colletiae]MCK9904228.1 cobalt-precorrin-6A reductase [Frankia sp. Cpl3]